MERCETLVGCWASTSTFWRFSSTAGVVVDACDMVGWESEAMVGLVYRGGDKITGLLQYQYHRKGGRIFKEDNERPEYKNKHLPSGQGGGEERFCVFFSQQTLPRRDGAARGFHGERCRAGAVHRGIAMLWSCGMDGAAMGSWIHGFGLLQGGRGGPIGGPRADEQRAVARGVTAIPWRSFGIMNTLAFGFLGKLGTAQPGGRAD